MRHRGRHATGFSLPVAATGALLALLALVALLLPAPAQAAPMRLLGPQVWYENTDAAICLGMVLSERLGECKDVDVLRASRAVRIANWVRGGAWDRTDREAWETLTRYVAVDAIVDVQDEPPALKGAAATKAPSLVVRTAQGMKVIAPENPDVKAYYEDLPGSTAKLIVAAFKALGLPEEDQKRGGEIRIKNNAAFRYYYVTQKAYAPWPANPYTNALKSIPADYDDKPDWALDAAILRVAAGYLHAYGTTRDGKEPRQALAYARGPLLRVLGTEREDAAEALMKLPRNAKIGFAVEELETQLLGIAQPLVYGKRLPGLPAADPATAPAPAAAPVSKPAAPKPAAPAARPVAPGKPGVKPPAARAAAGAAGADPLDEERVKEIEDIAEMTKDREGIPVEVVEKPSEIGSVVGKTTFTGAESAGALRLLGMMASEKALPLIASAARRDDAMVRESAAKALSDFAGDLGMPELERLGGDPDALVAFTAGLSLWKRQHARDDLRQRAEAMLDKPDPHRGKAAHLLLAMLSAKAGVADHKPVGKKARVKAVKGAKPAPAAPEAPAADEAGEEPAAAPTLDEKDVALLARLAADVDPVVRAQARALTPPPVGQDAAWLASALVDPEAEVVMAALKRVGPRPTGEVYSRLVTLANDPDNEMAWTAREALAPSRPAEPRAAVQFDLATTAPYLRQKLVAKLAKSSEPWAREEIELACANAEPHTRIAALHALADLDAARARGPLLKAMDDPHRLVRLEAAAMLAKVAEASQKPGIEAAIARQKDKATKLYLLDALAKATGTPPPPPPPDVRPANSILGGQNIAWLTGGGDGDSPYQAYYILGGHGDVSFSEKQRKSHDAGKIFFNRISPVGEPGTIMVDPLAQDNFWLSLDAQMPAEAVPYIDGLVYGEESMGMSPNAVWAEGWKLFCAETGIDPRRVKGDISNLNAYETRAFTAWGMRRAVEGFNRLYDYTKLKYGKLHPGIAVCTFLGEQALGSGENVADFDWKFDLGGIYHYIGHTRKDAFSLVRRYKTIWPDRPVLWLSNGIGVYERTPIQHTHLGPTLPITERTWRCYTDAVTAWMAGADTGWFSIWAFLPPHWVNKGMSSLEGPTIIPEEIVAGNPALQKCIDFAFGGMEEETRVANAMAKEAKKEIALAPSAKEKALQDQMDIIENGDAPDPAVVKIRAEKARMFTTFHIYRKFLFDCARLLQSLPRNNVRSDALVVQPGLTVWDGAIGSPGSDLLNYYDFVLDINKAPRLDLPRYRMIAVKDPGALTDETIAALTQWLRDVPGVLYVHLNLSADNADQSGTPEHFDGKLRNDWPWEADLKVNAPAEAAAKPKKPAAGEGLELTRGEKPGRAGAPASLVVPGGVASRTFTLNGPDAKAIFTANKEPVLAIWRKAGFKGVVIFDGVDGGGKPYRSELRDILNDLHAELGVGVAINGPIRQEMLAGEHFIAQTSAGAFEAKAAPGVDVITGEINPVVGTHKSAALVLKDFQGKFAAEINGVTVLCDKPIKKLDKVEGGIRITCDGLMQFAAAKPVTFKPESGEMPPTIAAEKLNDWVLLKTDAGTCQQPSGGAKDGSTGMITYVRCAGPVVVTVNR